MATAALAAAATAATAESTDGEVLAYDRQAQVIVLADQTVWTLQASAAEPPEDLKAGDRVRIEFTQLGDDGVTSVTAIRRVEE